MKPFLKSILLATFIGITTMLPIAQSHGQSKPKPAVVVSVSKVSEQMKDVDYLLTTSGFPEMKFLATSVIKQYITGVDADKDAGAMLFFEEDNPVPNVLGFIPVSDFDAVLDVIADVAEVEEDDDSVSIILDNGVEIFAKEKGGFAFVSSVEKMLGSIPENPTSTLGDLPSKYNLAVKVFAQRIPIGLREQVISLIKESSDQTFDQLDTDLGALQRQNFELQMKQLDLILKQTETITIGMAADQESNTLITDFEFIANAGSELADKIAGSAPKQPSRFTGFLMDGAAATFNQAAQVQASDAADYSKLLDELKKTAMSELEEGEELSDEDFATVEKAVGNLIDSLKATLKAGVIDLGGAVLLGDGEINFAAGGQVADPDKIEQAAKELLAMAEEKLGGEIEVNLNSGSHKSITLHQVVFQIPDDEEEARDMFGDQLTIVLGIGKNDAYIAGGSRPVETLKKAIDGSNSVEELAQFNVFFAPILEFAAGVADDPNVKAMADALKESGEDRIRITSGFVKNGMKSRFEMQGGILGLIKVGFEGMQRGFGPGGGF